MSCPVCGVVVEDAPVTCARCGIPYHMECWFYLGRCAIFGCAPDPVRAPPARPEAPLLPPVRGLRWAGRVFILHGYRVLAAGIATSVPLSFFASSVRWMYVAALGLAAILVMGLLVGSGDPHLLDDPGARGPRLGLVSFVLGAPLVLFLPDTWLVIPLIILCTGILLDLAGRRQGLRTPRSPGLE